MKAPGGGNYLLGHWTCQCALALGTWVYAMQWLTASGSWFPPALGLYLVLKSAKARKRVKAYEGWRRSWNEVAGLEEEKPAPARRRGGKRAGLGVQTVLVWITALLLYAWLDQHAAEPLTAGYCALLTLLLILMAWGVVAPLLLVVRRLRGGSSADATTTKRRRAHIVSVCLPVPASSPAAGSIASQLPDYCRALLRAPGKEAAT